MQFPLLSRILLAFLLRITIRCSAKETLCVYIELALMPYCVTINIVAVKKKQPRITARMKAIQNKYKKII